ncbi:MAG: T9SS type A sorting domain-containing protein [Candidatus Latescibacteria bacterium]|nr:T9SS type A sorting domain-containing protein [Candidatus Latescibacterota bacterium]
MKSTARWLLAVSWLALLPVSPGAQEWVRLNTSGPTPPHRSRAAAICDPRGHRLVVFGGTSPLGNLNDIWALDLGTLEWADLTPLTDGPIPRPRLTPSAVYDPGGHRMLMWSGQGDEGFFNDLWAFDLKQGTWTELNTTGAVPNRRYGTVSALDPGSGSMAIFAGFTDEGRFGDTWRYALESRVWTRIFESEGPGLRCLHSASFDRQGRRMIIYGGQRSGPLDDIWAFEFATDTWTELTPEQRPPGRMFTAQVYDAYHHRVLLVGGNLGEQVRTNEVWAFDLKSNTWELLNPQGTPPPERDGAVAVYVESEGRVVVFGGGGSGVTLYNDTWSLEGISPPAPTAVAEAVERPPGSVLGQNYPNPANPATTITYELAAPARVRLSIVDVLGREVRRLAEGPQPAGQHAATWDGRDQQGHRAGSGTYLYRLETPEGVQTKKLVLVR